MDRTASSRLAFRLLPPLLLLIPGAGIARAQPDATVEFEAVSIKPTPAGNQPGNGSHIFGCRGGPGSSSPGLVTCSHERAGSLVPIAYGMALTRVYFAKSAIDPSPQQFEITAKVPHGATKEQVNLMWQNLLKDRFQLAVHRETKEVPVYELVIARGGFKAREWIDRPGDPDVASMVPGVLPNRDKDGFPLIAPGETLRVFTGDTAYYAAPAATIKVLARMLEAQLAINGGQVPRPVLDATGLQGKYDLKISWSPRADSDDSAEGLSLLSAVESQLGLKLQPRKSAPVEFLIIDHLAKTPTEN